MQNSGYHDCPCPDCFEIAIGCDGEGEPSLCHACEAAGCDGEGDCQAPHAYCEGAENKENPSLCADCAEPF